MRRVSRESQAAGADGVPGPGERRLIREMTVGAAVRDPVACAGIAEAALREPVAGFWMRSGCAPEHAWAVIRGGVQRGAAAADSSIAAGVSRRSGQHPACANEPFGAGCFGCRRRSIKLFVGSQARRADVEPVCPARGSARSSAHVCRWPSAVMSVGQIAEVAGRMRCSSSADAPIHRALLASVPEPDPVVNGPKPRCRSAGEIRAQPRIRRRGARFHARCPIAGRCLSSARCRSTRQVGESVVACPFGVSRRHNGRRRAWPRREWEAGRAAMSASKEGFELAGEGGGLVGEGADRASRGGGAGAGRLGRLGSEQGFAGDGEVACGEALDEVGGALEGAVDVGAERELVRARRGFGGRRR
jgi:hypothetical protein